MTTDPTPTPIRPSAMTLADLARMLSQVGEARVSASDLESEIEAGAPTNEDGTLNLVHYAAWLVREVLGGE